MILIQGGWRCSVFDVLTLSLSAAFVFAFGETGNDKHGDDDDNKSVKKIAMSNAGREDMIQTHITIN